MLIKLNMKLILLVLITINIVKGNCPKEAIPSCHCYQVSQNLFSKIFVYFLKEINGISFEINGISWEINGITCQNLFSKICICFS